MLHHIDQIVTNIWHQIDIKGAGLQCQLSHFTAIHNSSPVASWDSNVSIEYALQNHDRNTRSSVYFCLLF